LQLQSWEILLIKMSKYPAVRQGKGLLLGEASHGNLQAYINANNPLIDLSLRKKWCLQSAEAIA
jgi:hypothetical protein